MDEMSEEEKTQLMQAIEQSIRCHEEEELHRAKIEQQRKENLEKELKKKKVLQQQQCIVSEEEQIRLALEASLLEEQASHSAEIVITQQFLDFLKTNGGIPINYLKRSLGVLLTLDGCKLQIAVLDSSSLPSSRHAVLAAAKQEIENKMKNTDMFKRELAKIEQQMVHVFVDNSNISIGAQRNPDGSRDFGRRVNVSKLCEIVEGFRDVKERVVAGSVPQGDNVVWQKWKDSQYKVHLQTRLEGVGEQMLDDAIIGMVYSSVNNNKRSGPRTVALLTGDGNDNDGRSNFPDLVQHIINDGWNVEIWCWRECRSRKYIDLLARYANTTQFKLFHLDNWREDITFHPQLHPAPQLHPGTSTRLVTPSAEDHDPYWMNCVITQLPFVDPVQCKCGHHFERTAILHWLRKQKCCPLTKLPLHPDDLKKADQIFLARLAAARKKSVIASPPQSPIPPRKCSSTLILHDLPSSAGTVDIHQLFKQHAFLSISPPNAQMVKGIVKYSAFVTFEDTVALNQAYDALWQNAFIRGTRITLIKKNLTEKSVIASPPHSPNPSRAPLNPPNMPWNNNCSLTLLLHDLPSSAGPLDIRELFKQHAFLSISPPNAQMVKGIVKYSAYVTFEDVTALNQAYDALWQNAVIRGTRITLIKKM